MTSPDGVRLEYLVVGSGEPTTIFAHGLGSGIAETRPLGSGVLGRKVFFQFRGHGRSDAPDGVWSYADLAADLAAVADHVGATRALGVSLGAGALCRLLATSPNRFERLVFYLPAVLDLPRPGAARDRLAALLAAVDGQDHNAVAKAVADEVPQPVRHTAAATTYVMRRAATLLQDGLAAGLRVLPEQVALPDRSVLAQVTTPALVIGCLGDELHPESVALELAAALPRASVHIYDSPAVLWTDPADLRARIAGFLAE